MPVQTLYCKWEWTWNDHQLTCDTHASDVGMSKYHPGHAKETDAVKRRQSAATCRRTFNWQDPLNIGRNRKSKQVFPYATYKYNIQKLC